MADYSALIDASGRKYNVDPALLRSLIHVESGGDPNAVSSAGAIGLTQILPSTAKALGVDPHDPAQAIEGAAKLLRENLDRYQDPAKAVAAYHGGTDTKNWGPKTMAYVGKISSNLPQNGASAPDAAPLSGAASSALAILSGGPSTAKDSAPQALSPAAQQALGVLASAPESKPAAKTQEEVATELYNEYPWYQKLLVSAGGEIHRGYNAVRQTAAQLVGSDAWKQQVQQDINADEPFQRSTEHGVAGVVGHALPYVATGLIGGGEALAARSLPAAIRAGVTSGASAGAAGAALNPLVTADGKPLTGVEYWKAKGRQALGGALSGAVTGGVLPLVGAGISAANQGIRHAINPLTEKGAQRQADELLAASVSRPLQNRSAELVPGSRPTLAEVAASPELAGVVEGVRTVNPAANAAFQAAAAERQTARNAAFQAVRGTPDTLEQLKAARDNAAAPLYAAARQDAAGKAANSKPVAAVATRILKSPAGQRTAVSSAVSQVLKQIRRPNTVPEAVKDAKLALSSWDQATPRKSQATQAAMKEAATILNRVSRGTIDPAEAQKQLSALAPTGSTAKDALREARLALGREHRYETDPEQLYGIRQNINDMLDRVAGRDNSASQHASAELIQIRDAIDRSLGKVSPLFEKARTTYAQESHPINVQKFLQERFPNAAEKGVTPNQINQLLGAIQKGQQGPGAHAAKSFTPAQIEVLKALQKDFQREAVPSVGAMRGSPTAKRAVDAMREQAKVGALGSLVAQGVGSGAGALLGGVPGAAAGSLAAHTLGKARSAGAARVQAALVNRLLDPQGVAAVQAAKIAASKPSVANKLLSRSVKPSAQLVGRSGGSNGD